MARKRKSMPVMYEIVLDKILSTLPNKHKKRPKMKIKRFNRIISIIYHIPKEMHYNVLKEFEQYGAIRIKYGVIEIRFKSNGAIKK